MKLKSKLPNLGLTIFSEMTRLANDVDAINLSQGFPDFEADPELFALVDRYMQQGCNQYAPMQGVALLRERIADKVRGLYRVSYDPASEITVTSGATEALFAAITAVVIVPVLECRLAPMMKSLFLNLPLTLMSPSLSCAAAFRCTSN